MVMWLLCLLFLINKPCDFVVHFVEVDVSINCTYFFWGPILFASERFHCIYFSNGYLSGKFHICTIYMVGSQGVHICRNKKFPCPPVVLFFHDDLFDAFWPIFIAVWCKYRLFTNCCVVETSTLWSNLCWIGKIKMTVKSF